MDKLRESKLFEYIYGYPHNWVVTPLEAPDFICFRNNIPVLGVEVTELYQNQSDARLKNIDGYALNLLDGGNYRHKKDKKQLPVNEVDIIDKADNKVTDRKIKAIIQELPSLPKRIIALEKTIEIKEKKLPIYEKTCREIDLIIDDVSNIFFFNTYEILFSFLSLSSNKHKIISSHFREIFLVTINKQQKIIRIPLKSSLFLEDAMIFEEFIFKGPITRKYDKSKLFSMLLYCLSQLGYDKIRTKTIDGDIGLAVGSYLYLYSQKGKRILDHRLFPEQLSNINLILTLIGNLTEAEKKDAETVIKKRLGFKCCIPLLAEVGL